MKSEIRMVDGGLFDPAHPSPEGITIRRIAHGLAHEPRFSGQSPAFYSVAQHSVLVMNLLKRYNWFTNDELLKALLHDAEEGLGFRDIARPIKHQWWMWFFRYYSHRLQRKIFKHFEVPMRGFGVDDLNEAIKDADEEAYLLERAFLWKGETYPSTRALLSEAWSPARAEHEFKLAFAQLSRHKIPSTTATAGGYPVEIGDSKWNI